MKAEHVLIVGGTKGAGRAMVRHCLAAGARVSVFARQSPSAPCPGTVHYRAVEIADARSVRRGLRDIWRIGGPLSRVLFFQRFRGAGDDWAGEWETSLTGTRRIIDLLVEEFDWRNGAIVVVSSVNARFISKHQPLSYHVGKAGLNQLVRYYAVALGPRGIRVNSVSPGTFLKDESKDFYQRNPRLRKLYQRMVPLGRMGSAEEVAQVAGFLSSPQAGFVTGQDLVVDGGVSLAFQEALVREMTRV